MLVRDRGWWCSSDYSVQPDGSRDSRAVRGAVDEFANLHKRQVQITYSDGSLAYFWYATSQPLMTQP